MSEHENLIPRASDVGPERSWFDHFADRATGIISHGPFFVVTFLVVVLWMAYGVIRGFSTEWVNAINTAAVLITLLMVALLENELRRSDQAVQRKLNGVLEALAEFLEKTEVEPRQVDELRAAIALEERESTPGARS
ncbi:MAG: low affinity iron permease family protein [Actinomycetota bacterium]|nr:low affinity iron permease family protein [Actinomycetota bacterium]